MKTTYIAQPFNYEVRNKKTGKKLLAESPFQFATAEEAKSKGVRLAERCAGVVVIAQKYDAESGEMGEFEILAQHGEVPEGLLGD